ncbi:GyrI-like domain-containing protein [Rhodococcus chondri]|uniref:GyrI-like domain-containing protein n=1 Tax=Rhodococcus chondri TaxID=3065941 RepID=A0ABU7JLN7_9NOCA|nr:GyrI-like domain-containing protein [Rhodococcus sp. CC-R104]MEE2030953.1 GyrI-like domain-containing protein [Rhodococcus sp. CC-R104]
MPHIVHAAPRHLVAVEFHTDIAHIGEHLGRAYTAVAEYLERSGRPPSGAAIAYFRNFTEGGFDCAAGFEVDAPLDGEGDVVPVDLPGGGAATDTHHGPYDTLEHTYEALATWAAHEGHELDLTTAWEEYPCPPDTPAEELRTVVYVPVRE